MNQNDEKIVLPRLRKMWRGRRVVGGLVVLAGTVVGCGDRAADPEGSAGEMTAAEMATMEPAEPSAGAAEMTPDEMAAMGTAEADQGDRTSVYLTPEQERALGVTYVEARRRSLDRTIRTVGRIDAAEPRIADVTPKIDGFVEQLFVATTGEFVRRGQRLLSIYSPLLVAAQEELLTARRLATRIDPSAGEAYRNSQAMLDAARRRLIYWDITEEQIQRLEETGEVTKTLTLVAPVSGIVLEKDVFEGQRTMPGMRLYRIADLSTIWVEGEVFEQDLQFVQTGAQAHIELAAYPGEHIMGTVTFVYPTVEIESRTNRIRITVPNPDLRLKPGMYVTVFFDVEAIRDGIAVPLEAVIVTGVRDLVFVRDDEGMLAPREVVLGNRAGDQVQILDGLTEGEMIVASANFLIDAESRLAGSGGAMAGMQHESALKPAAGDTTPTGDRND
ncbi:MAG: efflux RND transporter periplasmic adaptor subunit [Gemmatimonadota bacterium]